MRNARCFMFFVFIALFVSGALFAQTLSTGLWIEGNLPGNDSEEWYTFNVYTGITYYVWVYDSGSSGATPQHANVRLDARYGSQTGTPIFQNSDGGAGSRTLVTGSQDTSFRANQDATVHLRVFPDQNADRLGRYMVVYTTTRNRPSIRAPRVTPETTATRIDLGPWVVGELRNRSSEDWYSFDVDEGVSYYIWVKDRFSSGVSRTDGYTEIFIDAKYTDRNGTVIFQNNEDSNLEDPATFVASQRDTVFLRVHPHPDTSIYGRYRVVVTTNNSRPSDN